MEQKEDYGGYAGIHVPWEDANNDNEINEGDNYATLNLFGDGTICAFGGNAGDGGSATSGNSGGAGRWSELGLE